MMAALFLTIQVKKGINKIPGHMKQVIFGALDFARIRKRLSRPF